MDAYKKEILEWQEKLDTDLRKDDSWLALAGLYWLDEGENSFGSGEANDIVFPNNGIPESIGLFIVEEDKVKLQITGEPCISTDGDFVEEAILQSDASSTPTKMRLGALSFILLQRADGFGIRLWDNSRAERETFPVRQWFPFQEEFRIVGEYQRYDEEHLIRFQRKNGTDFDKKINGVVKFSVNGEDCSLLASENSKGGLFIIFKDETSKTETYSAGRYLTLRAPEDGKVI